MIPDHESGEIITLTSDGCDSPKLSLGTVGDLDALDPLLPRAYACTSLPCSVEEMRELLRVQLRRSNIIVLLVGRPPEGFCWMEIAGDILFIHLLYMEETDRLPEVWATVHEIARSRGCTQMHAHVFRTATARWFKEYGFCPQGVLTTEPQGILISREVS